MNWKPKDIPVIVVSQDTQTGEIIAYDGFIWDYFDGTLDPYFWQWGNFSCDCNRRLFHERAKGNDMRLKDTDCGEGRYKIDLYREDNLTFAYGETDK